MIETDRLNLWPLTEKQLWWLLEGPTEDEVAEWVLEPDLLNTAVIRAIGIKLHRMCQVDAAEHVWLTYWLMVLCNSRHGVGMLGFKGLPNEAGEVELGYGTSEAFRGQGLMSEAVTALVDWAFVSGRCRAVLAETLPDNVASQRVLSKVGFERIAPREEGCWRWRLEVQAWKAR